MHLEDVLNGFGVEMRYWVDGGVEGAEWSGMRRGLRRHRLGNILR